MTTSSTALPTIPTSRIAGLDGMRALAVALVVASHLFPASAFQGGFIGVDVFFVISGFLITSLLLREHAASGRIDLPGFWRRRARRLLPALAVLVGVCATAAGMIGGDVLVRLGTQVLGAATFSYNWLSIAGGTGYFSATSPELLRNLWSLAVEEQFYLVWPLVLPLFLLVPRAWTRAAAALLLAAASAAWALTLAASGADLTRIYFGTDTHAFGLLLGVALAFGLERMLSAPPGWATTRRARVAAAAVGAASLCGLVALATVAPALGGQAVTIATVTASALSALAVLAAAMPGSWFGRAVDTQPLRWIGDRSYGIYLWHWPLLVLLLGAADIGAAEPVPLSIAVTALIGTLVVAELSYRLIERPVRRRGFRGALAALGRRLAGSPLARLRALTTLVAAAAIVAGASAAVAAAPAVSSGQTAIEAGAAALRAASAPPPSAGHDDDAAGAAPTDGARGALPTDAPLATAPTPSATPEASAAAVTGDQISAIGDSVMLASAPSLLERFPGIQVDAQVSRPMRAGPGIVQSLADRGELRRYVVVGLGTNGPIDQDTLARIAQICGPSRQLVLVNAFAPRDWIPGVNAELASFAATHPDVAVADWAGQIAPHNELLAEDDIHPGDAGGRIFAAAVASAVDELKAQRIQRDNARERWLARFSDSQDG